MESSPAATTTTGDEFEPAKEFVVTDLETLRVVSDPLRIQLLELLVRGPRTVKQLAADMGTTQTKLYYHLNLLEEHGLVRVVSTRVVSGIIEKQYGITAYSFRPDPALFSLGGEGDSEGLPLLLSSIFGHTQNDISRSAQAGLIDFERPDSDRTYMLMRTLLALSPKRAEKFGTKLKALVAEYSTEPTRAGISDTLTHGLMIAYYPLPQAPQVKDTKASHKSKQETK